MSVANVIAFVDFLFRSEKAVIRSFIQHDNRVPIPPSGAKRMIGSTAPPLDFVREF